MLIVEITERRPPRSKIRAKSGYLRYDTWLEREAERLRAGRFWRQVFVDDEEPDALGVALVGVPRLGEPTRIVSEDLTSGAIEWSRANGRKIA